MVVARRRAATARDVFEEAKVQVVEAVLAGVDRMASEQVLREAGPILEQMRSKAAALGAAGEPFVRWIDRTLKQLRRRAGVR